MDGKRIYRVEVCKPTDIELIHLVLHDNDSRAFGVLMQRYTSQVYGVAIRLMQDEDEAADIVQQAFIQAYKQLDSWRGESFGAWVSIITNHLALRTLERAKRRQSVPLDENTDPPEEAYDEEHEQKLQSLEEAVERLPEQDKQLIKWHYYDGIQLQTIAERVGQTENNVKVRIFRIRERIKKMMQP